MMATPADDDSSTNSISAHGTPPIPTEVEAVEGDEPTENDDDDELSRRDQLSRRSMNSRSRRSSRSGTSRRVDDGDDNNEASHRSMSRSSRRETDRPRSSRRRRMSRSGRSRREGNDDDSNRDSEGSATKEERRRRRRHTSSRVHRRHRSRRRIHDDEEADLKSTAATEKEDDRDSVSELSARGKRWRYLKIAFLLIILSLLLVAAVYLGLYGNKDTVAGCAAGLTLLLTPQELVYVWYIEFQGKPDLVTAKDLQEVERGIESILTCGELGRTYLGVDASATMQNPDDFTANFVLEVNLNGTTRFKEFQDKNGLLLDEYNYGDQERRLGQFLSRGLRGLEAEEAGTTLPTTREAFLQELNEFLRSLSIPHITAALGIVETQPIFVIDREEFQNVTLLLDLQIDGTVSLVTDQDLKILVDYVIASYNFLKTFGDTCDTFCLTLLSGNVEIDPNSILLASNNCRRNLDETVVNTTTLSPTTTPVASPTGAPIQATPNPTVPFVPTRSPTQSPTFRGVDRFTLKFTFTATCRGCPNNVALFNQVVGRRRQLQLKDQFKRFLTNRRNLNENTTVDEEECLCPINARPGQPAEAELIALLQERVSAELAFVDTFGPVVETEFFACKDNQEEPIFSNILIKYEGNKIPELPNEIEEFEEYVGWAYNKSSEMVCDIYSTVMIGVKFVKVTDFSRYLEEADEDDENVPSSAPTVPFVPTFSPTFRPTFRGVDRFSLLFELVGTCNGCPNGSGFFNQVVGRRTEVLEIGSLSAFETTKLPFQRHLEEDLCACDKELFKGAVPYEIFTAVLLSKAADLGFSNVRKVQETVLDGTMSPTVSVEPSKAPTSSPSLSPVVSPQINAIPTQSPTNIPNKDPTASPTTPSPTRIPADDPTPAPSNSPTETASENPTSRPSQFPSVIPTDLPTPLPTAGPTFQPAPGPTPPPTPPPTFDPTESPTADPTPDPTPVPSLAPSTEPSKDPSPSPSRDPSREPSPFPTSGPTSSPTSGPTSGPTLFCGDKVVEVLVGTCDTVAASYINDFAETGREVECDDSQRTSCTTTTIRSGVTNFVSCPNGNTFFDVIDDNRYIGFSFACDEHFWSDFSSGDYTLSFHNNCFDGMQRTDVCAPPCGYSITNADDCVDFSLSFYKYESANLISQCSDFADTCKLEAFSECIKFDDCLGFRFFDIFDESDGYYASGECGVPYQTSQMNDVPLASERMKVRFHNCGDSLIEVTPTCLIGAAEVVDTISETFPETSTVRSFNSSFYDIDCTGGCDSTFRAFLNDAVAGALAVSCSDDMIFQLLDASDPTAASIFVAAGACEESLVYYDISDFDATSFEMQFCGGDILALVCPSGDAAPKVTGFSNAPVVELLGQFDFIACNTPLCSYSVAAANAEYRVLEIECSDGGVFGVYLPDGTKVGFGECIRDQWALFQTGIDVSNALQFEIEICEDGEAILFL